MILGDGRAATGAMLARAAIGVRLASVSATFGWLAGVAALMLIGVVVPLPVQV